jgi:hypothetical protein
MGKAIFAKLDRQLLTRYLDLRKKGMEAGKFKSM